MRPNHAQRNDDGKKATDRKYEPGVPERGVLHGISHQCSTKAFAGGENRRGQQIKVHGWNAELLRRESAGHQGVDEEW